MRKLLDFFVRCDPPVDLSKWQVSEYFPGAEPAVDEKGWNDDREYREFKGRILQCVLHRSYSSGSHQYFRTITKVVPSVGDCIDCFRPVLSGGRLVLILGHS